MYSITDTHLSSTELCVLGIHLSHLSQLSRSTSTVWPSLPFWVSRLVFYAQSTSVVISGQFPILSSKYTLCQVLTGEKGYYFLDFNIPSTGHDPVKPLHTASSTKGRGRLVISWISIFHQLHTVQRCSRNMPLVLVTCGEFVLTQPSFSLKKRSCLWCFFVCAYILSSF